MRIAVPLQERTKSGSARQKLNTQNTTNSIILIVDFLFHADRWSFAPAKRYMCRSYLKWNPCLSHCLWWSLFYPALNRLETPFINFAQWLGKFCGNEQYAFITLSERLFSELKHLDGGKSCCRSTAPYRAAFTSNRADLPTQQHSC